MWTKELLCPEVESIMEIAGRVGICKDTEEMVRGMDRAVVNQNSMYGYRHVHDRTNLGPYCSGHGVTALEERGIGLWIDPRPVLLHRIKGNTIDIGDENYKETLSLRMTQRANDSVLLTVSYGTILGNRWVALFKDFDHLMQGSGVWPT